MRWLMIRVMMMKKTKCQEMLEMRPGRQKKHQKGSGRFRIERCEAAETAMMTGVWCLRKPKERYMEIEIEG